MKSNEPKERYTVKEVKHLFSDYRDEIGGVSRNEFESFCRGIQILSKDIVDDLKEKVKFVLLSGEKRNIPLACEFLLDQEDCKGKLAVIVITPLIFNACRCIDLWPEEARIKRILHEVAHYRLGHKKYENENDRKEKEASANNQVEEWIESWRKNRKGDG